MLIKKFPIAAPLYNCDRHGIHHLVCRKSLAADRTLTAAANAVVLFHGAAVKHAAVGRSAHGAFHRGTPFSGRGGASHATCARRVSDNSIYYTIFLTKCKAVTEKTFFGASVGGSRRPEYRLTDRLAPPVHFAKFSFLIRRFLTICIRFLLFSFSFCDRKGRHLDTIFICVGGVTDLCPPRGDGVRPVSPRGPDRHP